MTEKKKTFLGHIRLLQAPGQSSSQDGSNSQVDQGTHFSVTPFHSPSLDQWPGQGANAFPCQSADRMVRECPSAADSLYISIPQWQAWTFKRNRGRGLQTSARTSTWATGWTLDSTEAIHVVGSLPTETACLSMGVLISSGQQWEKTSSHKTGELWSSKLLLSKA